MKKFTVIIAIIASIFAIGCAKKSPDNYNITSGRIVSNSSTSAGGIENKMENVTVFLGDNVRSDTRLITPQAETRGIQVWHGRTVYNWVVGQKTGQVMTAPANWVETMTALGRKSTQFLETAQNMGTEEIAGLECDVYLIENQIQKVKFWILKNQKFPLILKSIMHRPIDSKATTSEIEFGIEVDAEKFDVPQDIDFEKTKWGTSISGGSPGT